MAKKYIIALLVIIAILIALFMVNGYPKRDQGVKPSEGSVQDIEADLQKDVDTGAADFMKLDADIQKL